MTAHHAGTKAALGSHLAERTYPNFVDGPERVAKTAASFDEASIARLRAVKAAVDPDDVLRFGLDLA